MLKTVNKYCVFEKCNGDETIIDAYSTKEQATFKYKKMQQAYMEWCRPTTPHKFSDRWIEAYHYEYFVRKADVQVFVE